MGGKTTTKEIFLARAAEAHGDRYDYSQVVYTGSKGKVRIGCPEHGFFEQQAGSHTQGIKCPKCGRAQANQAIAATQADFLTKAREAHGDRYDYSQVVYTGSKGKVRIGCPEHGFFEQVANSHTQGVGCAKCGTGNAVSKRLLTLADFLTKAREAHGDRYDYSQVVYKRCLDKVKIGCPEHGFFEQVANSHVQGSGCQSCARALTGERCSLTLADFLTKAREAHGDRYDYSQVVYKRNTEKVKIGCPEHGFFEQLAGGHLAGVGCRKCGYIKNSAGATLTQADFLTKAREAHGDRYDYSQVVYTGGKAKVKIGCPEHGFFEQLANSHAQGSGCLACGRVLTIDGLSLTQADFLARAAEVHGDRYDYSQVVYKRALDKVKIGCPEHGFFEQLAGSHLFGRGCWKCRKTSPPGSTEGFLEKARATHGDTYDYSQVVYDRSHLRVSIICKKHGVFKQAPALHQAGRGCQKCGRERTTAGTQREWVAQAAGRDAVLYFLRIFSKDEEFYKVGITSHSVARRYGGRASLAEHYQYEILAQHVTPNATAVFDWEQSILETFAHLRYYPKKAFDGASECFSSCDEILSIFPL